MWTVSQIGAREHYRIAVELHRRALLDSLLTEFWWPRLPAFSFAPQLIKAAMQRTDSRIPREKVVSFNAFTFLSRGTRLLAPRSNLYTQALADGRRFAERVVRYWRSRGQLPLPSHYFGYNTGSLEVMRYLQSRGVVCVLDQIDPARFEGAIVEEERKEFPEWEATTSAVPDDYYRRTEEEWRLADLIVVNSEWSQSALLSQGIPSDRIFVLPLVVDMPHLVPRPPRAAGSAIRVLWLGTLNLRKGVHYLAEAARLLMGTQVQFSVAGSSGLLPKASEYFPKNVSLLGPVTRRDVHRLYDTHDVFVLPTLSDGFAITQLEAMSHGLPVITTAHCGRVVTHAVDGLIVPARSAAALAEAIGSLEADPLRLDSMQAAALRTAAGWRAQHFAARFDDLLEAASLLARRGN